LSQIAKYMMEKYFITAGPNISENSYILNPLKRFDLDEVLIPIRQKKNFELHTPRQKGQAYFLLALRDCLNLSQALQVHN